MKTKATSNCTYRLNNLVPGSKTTIVKCYTAFFLGLVIPPEMCSAKAGNGLGHHKRLTRAEQF